MTDSEGLEVTILVLFLSGPEDGMPTSEPITRDFVLVGEDGVELFDSTEEPYTIDWADRNELHIVGHCDEEATYLGDRLSCAVDRGTLPVVLPDVIYAANGVVRCEVPGIAGAATARLST